MSVKNTLHGNVVKNCLKETRIKKGINQSEMARLVEVSRQTIHAIEVDKYTPSVDLAMKIAKVLKTKVEKIFILEE